MTTTAVPPRQQIPDPHRWNTPSVFPTVEAWQAELAQLRTDTDALVARFQGHLGDDPSTLADWFEASEALLRRVGKIRTYATLVHAVDLGDTTAATIYDRSRSLESTVRGALAFAEPEILAIGFDTLRAWRQQEPRLAIYEQRFDELERLQAHVRSAEVEALLGQLSEPFRSATATHGLLVDVDLPFEPIPASVTGGEPIPIAQGNIQALLRDANRAVRRAAWAHYADAHLAYQHTLANVVATGVKQHVFLARARRYESSLAAALAVNHIPESVFHNLLDTFRRHLPTWHRYWRVRRAAMGVETLHVYDIKAPLTDEAPNVPFEQAMAWISEGMAPLGEAYVEAMRRGVREERWVDWRPNLGKRAGAFSGGAPGTHPFILMSYTDDLFSLSTLAHELGHSMHSYLTWHTQPYVYANYSIFLAEVASNLNQALTRAYLFEQNPDPAFQIALIEEAMSNFHRYFFLMPTLARFELDLHERVERGEALTAEGMNARMVELFREGYGGEVEMDPARDGITWAQFPIHLYLNFYVYQYATGIAAAHALAEAVLAGDRAAADACLALLRSGSSCYPLEALRRAGVDMTQPEPVEKAFGVLAGMVERLERLVAREG